MYIMFINHYYLPCQINAGIEIFIIICGKYLAKYCFYFLRHLLRLSIFSEVAAE